MPPEWYQSSENGGADRPAREPEWPELSEDAMHGLAGEIARAIKPHTEADTAAILANTLAAFGNSVGRGAYLRVGPTRHYLNLFVALVGQTGKSRKGTSWNPIQNLFHAAAPEWTEERILNGLSSGEGLIYQVRDRQTGEDKDGEKVTIDEGASDKRLLIVEGEFAGVLKVMCREGNTLSPIIRNAWDGSKLATLTRNSPMKATGAHVSIIGHITREELTRHLSATDTENGFANRFLWLMVKRSKELPFGGEWYKLDTAPLVRRLRRALDAARSAGEITWGDSAREPWTEVYGSLSEGSPGLFGSATSRAEAQTVRLAALYAVMDDSATIEAGHLDAALALWRCAEDSARYIFGNATGDSIADRIEEALEEEAAEGLTRTDIANLFGRNKDRGRIGGALSLLEKLGRVRREKADANGRGRPAERWFVK